MQYVVKLADTPHLFKQCFELRTRVFGDEFGYDSELEVD